MKIINFANKFEALLKERGLTQADLSVSMGVSERHISRMKKTDEVSEKYLKKLCNALDLPDDFFTKQEPFSQADYFQVPFREAGGGMGGGYYIGAKRVLSYISLRTDFLLTKTTSLQSLSFIHASGDSMSPTIPPDSMVLIDESQTDPINNKIYYLLLNDLYFIKRVEVEEGVITALISDNGNKREELSESDIVEVLGRAILQQSNL